MTKQEINERLDALFEAGGVKLIYSDSLMEIVRDHYILAHSERNAVLSSLQREEQKDQTPPDYELKKRADEETQLAMVHFSQNLNSKIQTAVIELLEESFWF